MSSTTRNHSSSQLQMGPNQKRGPPTLRRDEDPSWDCEDPLQLLEEAPGAHAMLFIIKIIVGIIIKQIPPEPGRGLSRWSTTLPVFQSVVGADKGYLGIELISFYL